MYMLLFYFETMDMRALESTWCIDSYTGVNSMREHMILYGDFDQSLQIRHCKVRVGWHPVPMNL